MPFPVRDGAVGGWVLVFAFISPLMVGVPGVCVWVRCCGVGGVCV